MAGLARFNVIVAIDRNGGISQQGRIPWSDRTDMRFFYDMTKGQGQNRNAVVMGRRTYLSIPQQYRPLSDRQNYVLSRKWDQKDHPEVRIFGSLPDALSTLYDTKPDQVWICGGAELYDEVIRNYLYLCDRIYVTKFKADHRCDLYFPWDSVKDMETFQNTGTFTTYFRYFFKPSETHQEMLFIDLLKRVSKYGETRADRTGVGTRSLFGEKLTFDISERIPLMTTRKMPYKSTLAELLFFCSGQTDTKILEEQKCKFWMANTNEQFLEDHGLDYEVGDMGPLYPFQLRHWGATYEGCQADYSHQGIDQLRRVIQGIQSDPLSRRHVISYWNVADLDKMVLNPCHVLIQFYVSNDRTRLSSQVYMRSGDLFLGVPNNIFSYAVLTYMIAHVCNLKPDKLHMAFGDCHIYENHRAAVAKQVSRTPRPWPNLRFVRPDQLTDIDAFEMSSFEINDYDPWGPITGKIAA